MNKVIIFSAPSGSGKTTLVKYCLDTFPQLQFSISCTTRDLRGTEVHGVDYHFISPDKFREKIGEDAFVEFEEVYDNKYYGTLKSEVERIWKGGKVVIFDVDVKGGISLKKYFGDQALSVFIMPPSVAELELRLIARGTDDLETIKTRVHKAAHEMAFKDEFDEIVVNNDLDHAKFAISKIVQNFLKS
ncbi:guanylate kinase [Kaistella jeonii]|uniref:Guanylate kinase n=1 Tax=Kaistella jeonii TaxID=266749 RepID=A0A0C1F9H3_9FLAO|nr:guanylate kinase [Kaistella jeonii]KIA88548.1 guanylate kinase [Kaistella jeonii]SFC20623.1 guanylate kinase [Kaistella jeonii]VEI96981.1 Guanylate kinase [Kaistella jeonii]